MEVSNEFNECIKINWTTNSIVNGLRWVRHSGDQQSSAIIKFNKSYKAEWRINLEGYSLVDYGKIVNVRFIIFIGFLLQ